MNKFRQRNLLSVMIFVGTVGLVAVLYTWALWRYFTVPVPGGNDFLTHYGAWEAYLKFGYSPYSEDAALHTQRLIYGRPARLDEDQNRMVYPFYSILVHGPFVWIEYDLARAMYMVLLQAALFAGVLMTISLLRWRLPTWLSALALGWSLLFYPVARGVILGQFAIFAFFSLAATLFFLERRRDGLAGALLVLSTAKPTLVFLVVPFFVVWAVFHRRWRFLVGFLGVVVALTIGGMLVYPNWVGDWIYRITRYSEYTVGQSPVWLLTHVALPGMGRAGEAVIVALFLAVMLFFWWRAFRPGGEDEFYWALGFTLVVSNLVVPRSATTNYVLMLVPTLWCFAFIDQSYVWGRKALLATLFVSWAGLWYLHFATVAGNQEQPIMFIPYPVILGLALIFWHGRLQVDARQRNLVL